MNRLLDPRQLCRALALPDLTEAAHGPHAMQLLLREIIDGLGGLVIVHRAPPIVSLEDNYDRLHYPPAGAARDARYTRYVTSDRILRTQTSAMIPELLGRLACCPLDEVLLACPGLVYRRDAIDRLHVGEPHQVDLWRIARRPLDASDLDVMIDRAVRAAVPGRTHRTIPAEHPYTEQGRQIEIRSGDRWIEIGECGLASPRILADAGLDREVTGLAMGLGLDRLLMLRKGIEDIRLLRSDDPRVRAQMTDLAPYRPVSKQPAIRRDLSLAVDLDRTEEELGDRVREALGDDAALVEAIELVSETRELPEAARARLGMLPGQKNALLRVVLRHLGRALSDDEANVLRDRIYAAVHEGTVWTWAVSPPPGPTSTRRRGRSC